MAKIPEGFNTITPTVIVNDAAKAIDLYCKAFGATESYRMNSPKTGKVMHACLQLGTSKLFLADASPDSACMAATQSNFYLYFNDVDAAFATAKQAGLQENSPVQDMFWGDRTGSVKDPFGNNWTLATHTREVSPEEIQNAVKKMAQAA